MMLYANLVLSKDTNLLYGTKLQIDNHDCMGLTISLSDKT
jgi:hypothetical protein